MIELGIIGAAIFAYFFVATFVWHYGKRHLGGIPTPEIPKVCPRCQHPRTDHGERYCTEYQCYCTLGKSQIGPSSNIDYTPFWLLLFGAILWPLCMVLAPFVGWVGLASLAGTKTAKVVPPSRTVKEKEHAAHELSRRERELGLGE